MKNMLTTKSSIWAFCFLFFFLSCKPKPNDWSHQFDRIIVNVLSTTEGVIEILNAAGDLIGTLDTLQSGNQEVFFTDLINEGDEITILIFTDEVNQAFSFGLQPYNSPDFAANDEPLSLGEISSGIYSYQISDIATQTYAYKAKTGGTSCGNGRYLYRGPRGGCYYINSNKNKSYVDRACCD